MPVLKEADEACRVAQRPALVWVFVLLLLGGTFAVTAIHPVQLGREGDRWRVGGMAGGGRGFVREQYGIPGFTESTEVDTWGVSFGGRGWGVTWERPLLP
jgi:hypothetical protein